MASAATYPKISRKMWWLVRDRFKKTVPSVVTPTWITSLAPMADGSARSNVIAPLRELGLLDESNKPTEWASRWRHDDEYAAVCNEIRSKTYPPELVEAFADADQTQKDRIQNWFMKVGHVGEAAARMYADTYLLLTEADPSKPSEKTATASARVAKTETSRSRPSKAATKTLAAAQSKEDNRHSQRDAETSFPPHRRGPSIHIDVQVHIAPDTTPEQIDRIFESMAKHLGTHIK